jgi:hypothetical protein
MTFELSCCWQNWDSRQLPAVNMTETTDGIFVVFIAGIPDTTEVHIRTQVNHAEWTCSGAEVKKTGIGSVYHHFNL